MNKRDELLLCIAGHVLAEAERGRFWLTPLSHEIELERDLRNLIADARKEAALNECAIGGTNT
jgi:hypothetical protein